MKLLEVDAEGLYEKVQKIYIYKVDSLCLTQAHIDNEHSKLMM